MKQCTILSPTAILGYGFPEASFAAGMAMNPDLIAVDAGSTDPGPYYLGSGKSFTDRAGVKRDLRIMLAAGVPRGIPVVIGTAGGCGARPHLQWTREIIEEIAAEERLDFTMALIASDIPHEVVLQKLGAGRVLPLEHHAPLTAGTVGETPYIVGQIGVEPIQRALAAGVGVVLAGRAYDPAVFAALPIARGLDRGLALHLGKILECAAIAAAPGSGSDSVIGILHDDHFELVPLSNERVFTRESTAAHSLYEKSDPYHLPGPGGTLDLTACSFTEADGGRVEVRGTRYLPSDRPTIKIEGARRVGYRTISIAGIRDPIMIAGLDATLSAVRARATMILERERLDGRVDIRVYGRDGVMGEWEPRRDTPAHEVGVVIDVVAETQDAANSICSLTRSTLLHYGYPGRISTAGNLAFPFSPSDLPAGPVFEFSLYHLMELNEAETESLFPYELVRVTSPTGDAS